MTDMTNDLMELFEFCKKGAQAAKDIVLGAEEAGTVESVQWRYAGRRDAFVDVMNKIVEIGGRLDTVDEKSESVCRLDVDFDDYRCLKLKVNKDEAESALYGYNAGCEIIDITCLGGERYIFTTKNIRCLHYFVPEDN